MNAVVWFRSDLRADDNRALHLAATTHDRVVGLFLLSPEQWREHHWGARKQLFVWQHVLSLRNTLAARGVPLWIVLAPRFADAPALVAEFAAEHGATCVYANAEYAVNERARDGAVSTAVNNAGIGWRCLHDFTLIEPGTVRTLEGSAFRVFTPFRRALLAGLRNDAISCVAAPAALHVVAPPALPDWTPPPATLDADWWPIGEDQARRRLARFIAERSARYHEDRNLPAVDGTSRLSPYLAIGAISIRRCVEAALRYNHGEWDSGGEGITSWLNELIWREFYTHLLLAFPRVSRNLPFRAATDRIAWREPGTDFDCWREGRTGYPLVDAAMRQLAQTGWMHNRLRMLSAMFLCKHLLIDWRHGERYFMQQLVDGELAANNGGWQWSASTGTDAAPYFRLLSPTRQAQRFDADGTFVRRYVPELAGVSLRALLKPGDPALLETGYPAPLIDMPFARTRVIEAFRAIADAPSGTA